MVYGVSGVELEGKLVRAHTTGASAGTRDPTVQLPYQTRKVQTRKVVQYHMGTGGRAAQRHAWTDAIDVNRSASLAAAPERVSVHAAVRGCRLSRRVA